MVAVALILGIVLGAAAAALFLSLRAARPREQQRALLRQLQAERDGKALELAAVAAELDVERRSFDEKLVHAVKAASAEAFRANQTTFLELADAKLQGHVAPLKESLEKVDGHVRTFEQARQNELGALRQELGSLREDQEKLRTATGNLVTALRAPHVRGRWGEVQLRRVIEAAGMIERCDFVVQTSTRDGDGTLLRPDVIVKLPGGKNVVIDAKVPLAAYLDAYEAQDEAVRAQFLVSHARQVREHVGRLAAKAYWRQFAPTPDFVIMFLPDETFLRAAQEQDSGLAEDAWHVGVVPASPTNLLTLLRTVAAAWQQETVAESAREIHGLGRELYDRLATMAAHVSKLGRCLNGAVGAFNDTVGSLESRVLVTARRFEEHGISGELPDLVALERQARRLVAPELTVALAGDTGDLPASRRANAA